MNWLQKIAYQIAPQIAPQMSPEAIIDGVLKNEVDGSSPDDNLPNGGWAYQEFTKLRGNQNVCDQINTAAEGWKNDSSSGSKLQILASAAGCKFVPPAPDPQPDQEQLMMDPSMMPNMGEQEQPMEMPSAEFG